METKVQLGKGMVCGVCYAPVQYVHEFSKNRKEEAIHIVNEGSLENHICFEHEIAYEKPFKWHHRDVEPPPPVPFNPALREYFLQKIFPNRRKEQHASECIIDRQ